jgi:hypothetical protein
MVSVVLPAEVDVAKRRHDGCCEHLPNTAGAVHEFVGYGNAEHGAHESDNGGDVNALGERYRLLGSRQYASEDKPEVKRDQRPKYEGPAKPRLHLFTQEQSGPKRAPRSEERINHDSDKKGSRPYAMR